MDSKWNTPHMRWHFASQGSRVICIVYTSCKFLFGDTELLTVLSVLREENPERCLQRNLASLREDIPRGTIINAGGIFFKKKNNVFFFEELGKNSVSPGGMNTEPSRGQRKIKRGKKIAITQW